MLGPEEDRQAPNVSRPQPVRIQASRWDNAGSYHDSLHGSPLAYAHTPLTAAAAALRWPSLRRQSAQPDGSSPAAAPLPSLLEADGSDAPVLDSTSHSHSLDGQPDRHAQGQDDDNQHSHTSKEKVTHEQHALGYGEAIQATNQLLQMPQVPLGRIFLLVAMFMGKHSLHACNPHFVIWQLWSAAQFCVRLPNQCPQQNIILSFRLIVALSVINTQAWPEFTSLCTRFCMLLAAVSRQASSAFTTHHHIAVTQV